MSSDQAGGNSATVEMREIVNHPRVYASVLELIGNTPLVQLPPSIGGRLRADGSPMGATLWGKLESANPAGSVKDRIALAMIEQAEQSGALQPGGTVIEPTSGNTGIGLALVCARKGYRCILTMPESMSLERRALLKSLGAEVILTADSGQMESAIARAKQLTAENPGYFMPQQFDNAENPNAHYRSTATEILTAFESKNLAAFVAGVGTGGTVSGVGKALRENRPDCLVVAVEAESCATISRGERGPTKIQGWAAGFVPNNYAADVPHQVRTVSDRDAFDCKRRLAHEAGLLLGISSGGAVHVAAEIARDLSEDDHVVVILPDTGERYFSLDEYFE